MATLQLSLKKKWFDMILSGEKKEEYREVKNHWISRFTLGFKPNITIRKYLGCLILLAGIILFDSCIIEINYNYFNKI